MTAPPIVLVSMPWAPLRSPSIQLGTVASVLARGGIPARVAHLYVTFSEMVAEREVKGAKVLEDVAPWFGEWVFAVPPFRTTDCSADQRLSAIARRIGKGDLFELASRIRDQVPGFLERCVSDLLEFEPKVVGFSTSFQQNVPSLVLARMLKDRAPGVRIVLGGANCAGPMGPALLRAFPWVDAVVSGEAEAVAGPLFTALLEGRTPSPLPGVSTRAENGTVVLATENAPRADLGDSRVPDYRDFFQRVERSNARGLFEPAWLPYEASRGCWWADRSACLFCGQNMGLGRYRSKEPDQVVRDLAELSQRHGRRWVAFVDNIMDSRYPRELFPLIRREVPGLSLFLSTKANLARNELEAMRDGGVVMIQPGIESLSTPILRLIRKGSTALQNVRTLKWAQELGLKTYWNLLFGFPGESAQEYHRMAEIIPALIHLEPPSVPAKVHVDRFSSYFSKPSEHGLVLGGPYENYAFLYGEGMPDLPDLAYLFSYEYADGQDPQNYCSGLLAAVDEWRRRAREGPRAILVHRPVEGGLEIQDTRFAQPTRYRLGQLVANVHLACDAGASAEDLRRGLGMRPKDVQECLEHLERRHLVFHDGARYLALSTPPPRA